MYVRSSDTSISIKLLIKLFLLNSKENDSFMRASLRVIEQSSSISGERSHQGVKEKEDSGGGDYDRNTIHSNYLPPNKTVCIAYTVKLHVYSKYPKGWPE